MTSLLCVSIVRICIGMTLVQLKNCRSRYVEFFKIVKIKLFLPLLILFAFGCEDNYSSFVSRLPLNENGTSKPSSPLTPSAASLTVSTNTTTPLSATGGITPYTFAIISGTGSINATTGVYLAPSSSGSAVVSITDIKGTTVTTTITINPALTLNASQIVLGKMSGHTYDFDASGGVPPYSFSLTSNRGSVNSSSGLYTAGVVTGTETLTVTDSQGSTATAEIKLIDLTVNGSVNAMVTNPNGSGGTDLFLGGNFTSTYPQFAPQIAKLELSTGNLDVGFSGEGFNGTVNAIVASADGEFFYVGGAFTSYRGQPANYLAKVDRRGNLDTTFTQSTGMNGEVNALLINGPFLYVGGWFTSYRGSTANYLAKIDLTSGLLDTTFTQPTGLDNFVSALASDGSSLYVGGFFTSYRSSTANYLAKMDLTSGNLDTTFTQATGLDTNVSALAISGTSLYVGGYFTSYRGSSAQRLAKLNLTSGNLDSTFTQVTGFNGSVNALAIDSTSLYIGGSFNTYRGSSANALAKVNLTTGLLDTTFTQSTGMNSYVSTLAINGTSIYAGGDFTTYRGSSAQRLAKLDLSSGNLDTTFTGTTGMNSNVAALTISGSYLYVGGIFRNYRGTAAERLAKFDLTSGLLDTTFTQSVGLNNSVNALAINGTSLYLGGWFSSYRGATAQRLAKIDISTGNLDTTFTQTTGMNSLVSALVVNGTSLYVGGDFTSYRGSTANYLAKINLISGNLDTTFTQATGMDSYVTTLAINGTSIYAGGAFTTYRGGTANYLAKLNLTSGNLDTTFTQATGPNSAVFSMAINGSSLYAGGLFTSYRGSSANYLAKIDLSSGNLDTTFTQASGMDSDVLALAINGTSIYVGGMFTNYRGTTAQNLAKIDLSSGLLDTTFTQSTGMNGGVYDIKVVGSALYLGGEFSAYRGRPVFNFTSIDLTTGD